MDYSSLGFSVHGISQEYWSELPFPSPGDLSDLRIEHESPALAGGFFTSEPPGKPIYFFFIAALFIIASRWKLLKCLSVNEWRNKMCIHTMEYYY